MPTSSDHHTQQQLDGVEFSVTTRRRDRLMEEERRHDRQLAKLVPGYVPEPRKRVRKQRNG